MYHHTKYGAGLFPQLRSDGAKGTPKCVSEKLSTYALWGYHLLHRISELGAQTCTIFGVVVHLPSFLDNFVLDFRSNAACRNYIDPKTSGVEISAKIRGFCPPVKIRGRKGKICLDSSPIPEGPQLMVYHHRGFAQPSWLEGGYDKNK